VTTRGSRCSSGFVAKNPRSRATLAQMAAAIALLQAAPIRRKNLTAIDLKKNLIARGTKLYLVFPEEEEVKTESRSTSSYRRKHATFWPGTSASIGRC
jgi:hypothetical protein